MFIASAFGQEKYLAIYYFKYASGDYLNRSNPYANRIQSLDGADFFRVLLPPSDGDKRFNVQEYYPNGKIKLIGKIIPEDTIFIRDSNIRPDGTCATYYPDGRKETIINYLNETQHGDEYLFFPSGKLYQYVINSYNGLKRIDCYDTNGNQVCGSGNGQWVEYDKQYKNIIVQGPVVNGKREGEWRQKAQWPDSIGCVLDYKNDIMINSYGLDKLGIKYPFTESFISAGAKGRASSFIQSVRRHLKLSEESKDEKLLIDTMHMSFIVGKDGSMSHYDVLGIVPAEIKNAIINAMKQCRGWAPAKLYGISLTTQLVLPMVYKQGYLEDKTVDRKTTFLAGMVSNNSGIYFHNDLKYWEKILPSD